MRRIPLIRHRVGRLILLSWTVALILFVVEMFQDDPVGHITIYGGLSLLLFAAPVMMLIIAALVYEHRHHGW